MTLVRRLQLLTAALAAAATTAVVATAVLGDIGGGVGAKTNTSGLRAPDASTMSHRRIGDWRFACI